MLFKRIAFFFIFLISLVLFRPAQLFSQELKFTRITAEQGLSMGVVNCVLQDSKGFMWFGTQDGLNRYDGYSITVLKHNPLDSNSLSNNFIYSLYEDHQGILWVGTNGGGLDAIDLHTGKISHYVSKLDVPTSLSNNNVRCVYEDRDGLIWAGTDEGLNCLDRKTGRFKRFLNDPNDPATISNNGAWCLNETADGTIWVGTYGGGLNAYNKKTGIFRHYADSSLAANPDILESASRVRSIYQDKDGVFWIGTYGAGVQIFDPRSGIFLKSLRNHHEDANSLINDRVTSVTEDATGSIWIGTYGGGLDEYYKKTGRFRHYQTDEKNANSLSSNQVKSVFHDKAGSVWIGTEGGGVNIYFRASNKFKYYKRKEDTPNSLQSDVVLALLEDSDGLLWIGTSHGGLTSLNRETETYTQYPELSTAFNNSILSLCEDKDGLIWVGTWGGGLNSYNKKTKKVTSYNLFSTQNNATIICIYQDSKGLLWIGTYGGGLYSYDKKNDLFVNYTTSNGLSSNYIYTVLEDSKGSIWVGTEGGGVCVLNTATGISKTYTRDEKTNSISSNSINHIYEDKQGIFWLATTNGLNRFDPTTEHFDHYFEKDGLPNDYIYCILPDSKGNLWMSTNKGVSKFNPAIKNENGSAFRNYDVNDGLQGMEHNQGAFFKSKTGEMFVGGVNGLNTFFPENIKDNANIPKVWITSYKRFGEEVIMDTLIFDKHYLDLSWQQNFFSFEFVSLDYQMPGKNKYSYKLDGVDENWSPPSTQRYASYTELRGGDYAFHVRASNNDGVWNDEGITLYIHINPPFWQTTWFYIICVIVVLAGFWGFLKYRTGSIKRENKILEEKVEERTQELAQKNKDITSSIQYAKRIQLAILPPLEQIFRHFPQSFIVYKPKDIVSGDFYWFGVKNGKKIVAIVDCTGHGVPGAFMSMIGHNLLNQIISENGVTEPDQILSMLHQGVQAALKQGSNVVDTSDGMDVALCVIDEDNSRLSYAGAYRPLYIFRKNDVEKIEADKNSIGGSQLDANRKFTKHTVSLAPGDRIYMTTDGYADQFGGEKGKKFMVKRFFALLGEIQELELKEQGRVLDKTFEDWRGNYHQVDDILVMGIGF